MPVVWVANDLIMSQFQDIELLPEY